MPGCGTANPLVCMRYLDSNQRHAKRLNYFLFEETVKNQVTRQDSRYKGSQEDRDAHHANSLKAVTVKMDLPCYKMQMPDERLPKNVLYEELQEKKRSQGGQKWRELINKGVALYEEKRICEAERKHRERKVKTMTLTCSTCNRQFRARISLLSHQRTQRTVVRRRGSTRFKQVVDAKRFDGVF